MKKAIGTVKKFFISDPLFGTGCSIFIGEKKDIEKKYDTGILFDNYLDTRNGGYNHTEKILRLIKSDIVTLVHELMHMIHRQLSDRGFVLNDDTEEVYAYMMGYYVDLFLKHIKGKKQKPK